MFGPNDMRFGALGCGEKDQVAYAIIDSRSIDLFMPSVFPPIQAETIEGLGQQLGLNTNALRSTIDGFNAGCKEGEFKPTELDGLATSGVTPAKTNWARPIVEPPFYAYELRPGVTFTYLGLKVDETAQVQSAEAPSKICGLRVKLWRAQSLGRVSGGIWNDDWNRLRSVGRKRSGRVCTITQSKRPVAKLKFAMPVDIAKDTVRSFPQSHLRVLSAMATSRIWPICVTTVGDVTMPANTRIPMNLT